MKVTVNSSPSFSVSTTTQPQISVANETTQTSSVVTNTPGATGLPGTDGAPGSRIYSGYPADNSVGIAGDFWFDTVNKVFVGPKTNVWPETGTSFTLNYFVEDIQITNQMIQDKQLTLTYAPTGRVNVSIYGGTDQKQDLDFIITGSTMNWASLGMEPLLDTATTISVQYPY